MRRLVDPRSSFFFAALALAAVGCFQDFDQYRPGQGGGGNGGGDACDNVDCNDDNPCTDDVCNAGTCEHTAAAVFTVPQTSGDCKEATCEGTEIVQNADEDDLPEDDGNPCTSESCEGDTPTFTNLPEGTTCNGDGQCSEDGLCSSCLEDDDCGTDTACADVSCGDNGECEADIDVGAVISGDDDGDCDALICVEDELEPQEIFFADDIEDDDNLCTTDTCDMVEGAVHTPVNENDPCDDGLFCTGTDTCNATGVCQHTGDPCSAGGVCANECNEAADNCFNPANDACGNSADTQCTNPDTCDGAGNCLPNHENMGTSCGDSANTTCTDPDTCDGNGNCQDNHASAATACDAGGPDSPTADDACTDPDRCDGNGSCSPRNVANGTGCNDGMFCTQTDTCTNGVCGGTGNPCSAGNVCNNTCNEAADNCFSPASTACDAGGPDDPTADNTCTDPDRCDGAGTCSARNAANGTGCNDTLFCTVTDTCNAGVCTGTGDPCSGGTECNNVCDEVDNNCFANAGTSCGSQANTDCTDPNTCNATGTCLDNHAPDETACDDAPLNMAGGQCTGTSADCVAAD